MSRAQRGGHIDSLHQPMRHRAAHEGGMKRIGNADIVDEPAGAAQQFAILDPRDAAPETSGGHVNCHIAGIIPASY